MDINDWEARQFYEIKSQQNHGLLSKRKGQFNQGI